MSWSMYDARARNELCVILVLRRDMLINKPFIKYVGVKVCGNVGKLEDLSITSDVLPQG